MFEKLAKALRGMGPLAAGWIPAAMRDAFLEMAREIDSLRAELDQLKKERQQ